MFGRRALQQKRELKTIGTAGVSRGIGTTFCTLMMAYFTKHVLKKRTAIMEKNVSGHLYRIAENELFSMKGIDILTKGEQWEQERIKYSYLFLDYGMQYDRTEFLNCSIKIIIASPCIWKREELFRFIDSYSCIKGNEEWIYLLPFVSSKTAKKMGKQFHRRMYAVAAEKDWYYLGAENLALWERIFLDYF